MNDLEADDTPYITVRIGVKPDAQNDGGINLFGKKFGNYETDLQTEFTMRINLNEGASRIQH